MILNEVSHIENPALEYFQVPKKTQVQVRLGARLGKYLFLIPKKDYVTTFLIRPDKFYPYGHNHQFLRL